MNTKYCIYSHLHTVQLSKAYMAVGKKDNKLIKRLNRSDIKSERKSEISIFSQYKQN